MPTTCAVIAEPDLSGTDHGRIEAIRRESDPQHGIVPPHITLVFPLPSDTPARLAEHVGGVACRHASFGVRLRTALPVKDPLGPFTHVYLVPEEGFSAIVRLHDALYSGPLSSALRLDVPYIPHLTVAAFADAARAKDLADRLNGAALDVAGRITGVSVLRLAPGRAESMSRFRLG